VTDHLTYEEFIETEEKEMNSQDKGKQNLMKCIEMADIVILNNGTIEDLREKVKTYLESIKSITLSR
jgi:dephospho-CoA kinase